MTALVLLRAGGGDKEYNAHLQEKRTGVEQIAAALQEQFGSGESPNIKLDMIFVWTAPEALTKALNQFKVIETFHPPGRMTAVESVEALTKDIRRALTGGGT